MSITIVMENTMEIPYKTKNISIKDPVILLPGIYPKANEIHKSKHTCMLMFIVVLFTIAKIWNQPRGPSTEQRKKMEYTYTVEYSPPIKKSEILSFAGKWIEMEDIMLSGKSYTERQISHVFFHMRKLKKKKSHPECRIVISRG